MGSKAVDDEGVSSRGEEGRNIKRAHVCGVYALAIWEMGNDGFVDLAHVGHGGSSCEKVTCHTRVKDSPHLYGSHVNIDSFRSAAEASAYFGVGVRQC